MATEEDLNGQVQSKSEYINSRKNNTYYQVIVSILNASCKNCASILDVGSRGVDVISDLPIPLKVSLDLLYPLEKEGIISIKGDFFDYNPQEKFDIVCCFQTLEHIDNAQAFAQKLLSVGKNVIISVPYMWLHGASKNHVQDPVYEDKLFSWIGRSYDLSILVREDLSRMILCYFENNTNFINNFVQNKITLYNNMHTAQSAPKKSLCDLATKEQLIKLYDEWLNILKLKKSNLKEEDIIGILKMLENGISSPDSSTKKLIINKIQKIKLY